MVAVDTMDSVAMQSGVRDKFVAPVLTQDGGTHLAGRVTRVKGPGAFCRDRTIRQSYAPTGMGRLRNRLAARPPKPGPVVPKCCAISSGSPRLAVALSRRRDRQMQA